MKSTKKSLFLSTISLVLCFAMLLGTTWAWFTDEVTSGVNQIKAGNLDVELYHATSGAVTADDANKVTSTTQLFNIEHWEPGMVAYENFMVKNVGNLALKYQLAMTVGDFNTTNDEAKHSLKEILKVAVVPGGFIGGRAEAQALTGYTTLENFSTSSNGALLPDTTGDTFGVVIYWQPTDNDNLYNLNNGKMATVVENKFAATELGIELGVKLTAQQLPHEEDSFDKFYDKADNEVVATWSGESEAKEIDSSTGAELEVKIENDTKATATVEAGTKVKIAGDTEAKALETNEKLKLSIKPDGTPNGITVQAGNSVTTYDVSLVKVITSTETGSEGTKTDVKVTEADKPVLVSLDIGIVDLVDFYHHGEKLTKVESKEAIIGEGMYWYDQTNGTVYFKTKSFSPFASVYKFAGGLGTPEHPYLIATTENFDAIHTMAKANTENANFLQNVNFKLVADLDYTGKEFPSATQDRIVWKNVKFDGADHKIIGAYATPAGKGFPECLMGNKYTGTNEIKNLTIENSAFNGLFYAGYSNTSSESLKITDVTIRNCAAYDGAFVNWGGETRVEIQNSKLENSSVMYRGWAGSVGGFVGNTQNAQIEQSSIVGSTIESVDNAVGGFICQGGSSVIVKDCTVDASTTIRNTKADGSAYAIAGTLSSDESTGNSFEGRVECADKSKVGIAGLDSTAYSKDSVWSAYNSDFTANQFTFSENGTITYSGTGSYDKFVVEQRIWTSNCTSGEYTGVGGFQKDFDKHEFITKDLTFTKLTKLQQYAPNATVAAMFKATTIDSSYVDTQYASQIATGGEIYIKDGVCTAKFLDEAGNGQFIGGTGKTDNKTDYTVTVLVKAMVGDTNVGSTSFTYVVPLATN